MEKVTYYTPNILIVDDVNSNLKILTEIVKNAGYVARPVASVNQAMKAIEASVPHLILLDISMPETDGFEFCTILKDDPNTRDIPIIFISALNSSEDKIKGFQLGAVDYITKPFEVEEVTHRMNTHLKIYKMHQELEIYNKKLYKVINRQFQKIYEEQRNILYALAKLSATREGVGNYHIERVAKNSKLLAMSMQLSPKFKHDISDSFIETIELSAPIHDIGKIGVSDSIWAKSTRLTPEEWKIMEKHTEIGANTLKEIYRKNENNEFIKMAIDIALYHHEKWDGSGFPKGLKGKAIPLCARIVSITNTYDTLISRRAYKEAFTHEKAMEIINERSGQDFDPDIVVVLNKVQRQLKN